MRNNVRLFRERLNWPQAKLSSLAQVDRSTVCLIERHNYEPSYKTKRKIAHALGATVAAIWPEFTEGSYDGK
jgi:DNA-binding XRE family transcriptional regulator